jgi:hypothetical protein
MTTAIRALQAFLLFITVGAAATAFVIGGIAAADGGSCKWAEEKDRMPCSASVQTQATAAFGIGVAGVATAIAAAALGGMVGPKPQVRPAFAAPQPPSGPYPQQQPPHYGPPR